MKLFSEFDKDLVEPFCSSNIPIKKIENKKLKRFFEKIKSESYYGKFVIDSLFKKKLNACYNKYHDKPIYLVFDETTDIRGRSILNILIGECGNSEDKACLIAVLELEKKMQ